MSPDRPSRFATAEDHPAVTETVALAFERDPVWSWAFPDPVRRLDQLRAVWGLVAESAIAGGWVRCAEGCSAVAIWIAPGRPELSPEYEQRLEPLLEEVVGEGAARVLDTFERFEAAHPEEPEHFYLSLLGTHPEQRGRGIGMALLAECLELIDAEGARAFLESSNPVNQPRYERLGFRSRGTFALAEDGPDVTQMWREPR